MSFMDDSAVSGFNPSDLIGELVAQAGGTAGAKLVLAYSGGVDSELLALGLSEFAREHHEYRYLLVHVHHGLSDNADAWVSHCESRANVYGLPMSIERVVVDTGPRKSLEAEARNARYDAIKSLMAPGDLLLTGHHLDDQLETVLLALKRGLGPKGLSAMGSTQVFDGDKHLIRPLLSISRELIEAKAKALGLIHITDESNSDDKYDRNFLRLDIIPRLKARWGAIATTASRSALLCAQQQAVIDAEVSERLPALISPREKGYSLDLGLLAAQNANWQSLLFRGFIEESGFAPLSQSQLAQVLSQLLTARRDAKVELRLGELLIRRYQQRAFLGSVTDENNESPLQRCIQVDSSLLDKDAQVSISLSKRNRLSITKVSFSERVRLPDGSQQVSIRFSVKGSTRCHPANRDKARELKKLWQEYGIAPWERARVPCIFYGERLVCAVGYWIESGFLCQQDERGLVFGLHKI